jgi:hypothetical protein
LEDPDFESKIKETSSSKRPPLPDFPPCIKCGSKKIVPEATVTGSSGEYSGDKLTVEVVNNPEAAFFRGIEYFVTKARLCGDCGYIELFASNPDEIYAQYLSSLKNGEQP